MLPLGTAMQETGAASYLASQVMILLGDAGPWPVIGGALFHYRRGDDDYSHRRTRRVDVADCAVRNGRSRSGTGDGNDGYCDGSICKLYQPDFSSGEYSCYGPGRLPVCRLPEDRRPADADHIRNGNGYAADLLATSASSVKKGTVHLIMAAGSLNLSSCVLPDPGVQSQRP